MTRRARTPQYVLLAADLRQLIANGHFKPGAYLPSEPNLARRYRVGIDTVRGALAILRAEGLIVTRHGYGTCVAEQREREIVRVPRGTRVSARLAGPEDRRQWGIPKGAVVAVFVIGNQTYPADRYDIVAG